jgi:hypothetical protein
LNLNNCSLLAKFNRTGTWYRAVPSQHIARAILTNHTPSIPSRFSAGSVGNPMYEILYLSENQITLPFETGRCYGNIRDPKSIVPVPTGLAQTIVTVQAYLTEIADLSNPQQADIIETNAQELTGDWETYSNRYPLPGCSSMTHSGIAPTQRLGEALFKCGLKGFITFSAAVPDFKNLVVFPQRLAGSPCTLAYTWTDPSNITRTQTIP